MRRSRWLRTERQVRRYSRTNNAVVIFAFVIRRALWSIVLAATLIVLIDVPAHALLHVVAALWDHCYFLMSAGGAWTESFIALDLAGLESGKTLLHVPGDEAVATGTYMDQDVIFAIAPHSIDEERCRQVLARFDEPR